MSGLEDVNNTNEQNESVPQIPEIQESIESVEDMQNRISNEMTVQNEELHTEDEKIETANNSLGLSVEEVQEEKNSMNLETEIAQINSEAEQLTSESKQEINTTQEKIDEWVKLENHQFDQNNYYRIINEAGYKDFKETGILRSSPTGTDSMMSENGRFDLGHRPTSFPSFSKGEPAFSFLKEGEDNFIFETDMTLYKGGEKNPVTGNHIPKRHWAYRPIDEETGKIITEVKPDIIKHIYKVDKTGDMYLKKD